MWDISERQILQTSFRRDSLNKRQKLINNVTKNLLENEIWLYGRKVTSFYRMRKFVKRNELV